MEGCLSFPNRAAKTKRPQKVTVEALDENGQSVVITGKDELTKCLCHKFEYLNGIVFIMNEKIGHPQGYELEHLDGIVFLDHATEEVFFEDE